MPDPDLNPDAADLQLLLLANDKRKFAIELGYRASQNQQDAFERGIDNEWFTLVDITTIEATGDRAMRIFRLTDRGLARLDELLGRARVQ